MRASTTPESSAGETRQEFRQLEGGVNTTSIMSVLGNRELFFFCVQAVGGVGPHGGGVTK